MASSNRHWPSMFKSKPCNTHHQWQHDINPSSLMSSYQRTPFNSGGGEERSPEPKPRWNPKPEQIRILEAIFNSGMVNPPRDEIRKIRAQLQEYGQVGDANVFYWFQNRKSRSKHKQKHLQTAPKTHQSLSQSQSSLNPLISAPSSSSSSSSEKSSPKGIHDDRKTTLIQMNSTTSVGMNDVSINSPTANSVNNQNFADHFSTDHQVPFFFPAVQQSSVLPQGLCFTEPSTNLIQIPDHHQLLGPCHGLLLSELLNQGSSKRDHQEEEINNQQQQLSYSSITSTTISPPTTTTTARFDINSIQGVAAMGGPATAARLTVFINDVAFEVAVGPFNVREAFGDEALLIHSSGQPVLTNQWGVTFQSLQPGAFYYLV